MNDLLEQDDNVVDMKTWKETPRIIPKTADKEPPSNDWLSRLPLWTEFLTRNKRGLTPDWVVVEWTMLGAHPTGNVLLAPTKALNDTRSWQWVDPIRFCQANEYRGAVGNAKDDGFELVDMTKEPED